MIRSISEDAQDNRELDKLANEYKDAAREYEEALANAVPDPAVAIPEEVEEAVTPADQTTSAASSAHNADSPVESSLSARNIPAAEPCTESPQKERLRKATERLRARERELEEKLAQVREAPVRETIWERETKARIRKARSIQRWRSGRRRLKKGLVVCGAAIALTFLGHSAYYMGQGLDPQQALRAVGYDWVFYLENAGNLFASEDAALSASDEGLDDVPIATSTSDMLPTPTADPTATPVPTGTPAPAATPTQEEINQAIDDYFNGRISREDAVDILSEERVQRLQDTFPHLR